MIAASLALSWLLVGAAWPDDEPLRFESRILPVLQERCFECHTRDGGMEGDLLLDSREGMVRGGSRGAAIVPGDPSASLLMRVLRGEHAEVDMPPDGLLDSATLADLEAWIEAGAAWPGDAGERAVDWWSFRAMAIPDVPRGDAENPVDRFLDARLADAELSPAPPADRWTLLRRVTFDLTGLPPTPAEVAAFVDDERPDAWERVVDRLLASSSYGEAWGRRWLDLARYADTAGDASDYPIEDAWRYRNWVLEAFRSDMPYDRFLRWQVAGDLLELPAHERADATVATGFLALARRFGVGRDQDPHLVVDDMIDTLGKAILAETLSCARCHDHKFDPIETEDYYGLYGIFASTQLPFPGSENERRPERLISIQEDTATPTERFRRDLLAAHVSRLEHRGQAREASLSATESQDLSSSAHELEELTSRTLTQINAYAVGEAEAGDAAILIGGDMHRRGAVVPRAAPAALTLPEMEPDIPAIVEGSGREQLAAWLTHPQNPRTARVLVNRVWHGHFGTGLVDTPSDFGLNGSEPSHPELLDWLARRFIEDGWSLKALHKRLLMTQAYQRASAPSPAALEIDPDNRLLSHASRRRLCAEELRDAALFLAGNLDLSSGEAHPFPEHKHWNWTQHRPFRADYETDRRSVYLMTQRLRRHPYLSLFDGPDTNASQAVRGETIVPAQALFLRNSEELHVQAAALGERLRASPGDDRQRIGDALMRVYARPATSPERVELAQWVDDERAASAAAETDAPEAEAWAALARVLLASNEFLYLY